MTEPNIDYSSPLDLYTDEELFYEIQRRQDAKELAYLLVLGIDAGDNWFYLSSLEYDQLEDVGSILARDFEDNPMYDSDNWTDRSDEEMEEWGDSGE